MEKILRTRLLTGLVLVVVFGAGLALGFAADRSLGAEPAIQAEAVDSAASDSTQSRRRPMYEQVGPTEAQKIQIDSIVRDYRGAMKSLHAEFRAAYNPRYQALIEETREAIRGVLTTEQAQAYDSLVAEYERRRAERSSGGGQEE